MGHHFVPQRYLRNFEDPSRPGFIWLHDKRGGAARLVPIKQVAQAKGFYTAETEASLARDVEAPGNAVIRKLTGDTAITIRVRKSSSGTTRYYDFEAPGTITASGFSATVRLLVDTTAAA